MSRFPRIASAAIILGVLSGVGVAVAAPPVATQAQDRAVWKAEGAGNGSLAKYKPATPPGDYGLGTTPTAAQIADWTIAIPPDGAGLPPGQGSVAQGETIYATDCAMCHGTFGEGANGYPQLAGGEGSLGTPAQVKTVGSYWPYATTVWDYINRAMPFFAPHTLKPDQVYALTAFLLNMNGIVPSDFVADAKSVPAVKMPNRDGFDWKDPRPVTHNTACMTNCADPASIKILSNAATMNLTPRLTGPVDHMTQGK
ncbi:MAG TPA: cytochrome c [Acidiphilium sp.]